jgi:hypothetical protein
MSNEEYKPHIKHEIEYLFESINSIHDEFEGEINMMDINQLIDGPLDPLDIYLKIHSGNIRINADYTMSKPEKLMEFYSLFLELFR